jgi:hypothetical protein
LVTNRPHPAPDGVFAMRCVLRQNVFGGLSPTADGVRAHRREFSYGRHGSPMLHPALESPPGHTI